MAVPHFLDFTGYIFLYFTLKSLQLGARSASSVQANYHAPCFKFYFVFTVQSQQMQMGPSKEIFWESWGEKIIIKSRCWSISLESF